MTTNQRIFKGLPDHTRKAIINQIITAQSHKSPRTKEMKDYDKVRYPQPLRGEQNFKPVLFDHCVKQHLTL